MTGLVQNNADLATVIGLVRDQVAHERDCMRLEAFDLAAALKRGSHLF